MIITVADKNVNNKKVNELINTYNINKDLATFLLGRQLQDDIINALLGDYVLPKHNNITNIEEGADLIAEYLMKENSAIYVYGDYDSDGVNSCFIINDCLTVIRDAINSTCEIIVHYPNRSEGYGLSMNWCEQLVNKNKIDNKEILVITVDNGITKHMETEYLLNNNINVLITDHHVPKEGETPEDVIIIDPHLYPETDKDSLGLCGAGVTYKLCAYLLEVIFNDDSNYHLIYLPHVAIATITDVMPLTVENAYYLKYGFYLIENDYCVKGIQYYKEYKGKKYLTTKDISWGIGPELNACGRMLNTQAAGDFLLADEYNVEDAYAIIHKINKERKEFQAEILEECIIQIQNTITPETRCVIVHVRNTGGVGGVIATKISDIYGLPSIVLSGEGDLLSGSARGIGNLDLHELFTYQVDIGNMLNFGGHRSAAGVTVHKDKIQDLQYSLDEILGQLPVEIMDTIDEAGEANKEVIVDKEISLIDINKNNSDLFKDIPLIGELTNPLYVLKDVNVESVSHSKNNPNNICFTLKQDNIKKKIWAWGFAEKYENLGCPKKLSFIGSIEQSFMNPRETTLSVEDIFIA